MPLSKHPLAHLVPLDAGSRTYLSFRDLHLTSLAILSFHFVGAHPDKRLLAPTCNGSAAYALSQRCKARCMGNDHTAKRSAIRHFFLKYQPMCRRAIPGGTVASRAHASRVGERFSWILDIPLGYRSGLTETR